MKCAAQCPPILVGHRRVAWIASLLGIFLMVVVSAGGIAGEQQRLPLEAFYTGAQISNVELSPDGTHLLALWHSDGSTTVTVFDLEAGERFHPLSSENEEFKFHWVTWANNDRLLVSLRFDDQRLHAGTRKWAQTRLLALNAKGDPDVVRLMRPERRRDGWISQFQDNVISMLPDDPEHILVSDDREAPNRETVYKVDVYTGKLSRVMKHAGNVVSWKADREGVVRIAEGYDDRNRKFTIRVRDPRTNEWGVGWEYVVFEEPAIHVMGFGKSANELYLLSDHEGRQAIFRANLSVDGYPLELVLSDAEYDIAGQLIYSPAHKDVVGIYYNDNSAKSVFWNAEFKAFQAGVDRALPDTFNYITSLSNDARKYIVFSSSATRPGTILFGDRDQGTLSHVADTYPALDENVLVAKRKLSYQARDGLELEAYLSLPRHYAGEPLATILLPHGGPMARDGNSFDAFSAFMVNRGYAVLQPNFRGSAGYGHNFMMMAVGGMGLAMQDDLTDAVKFLIDEKIADPGRVCIVGGSYGGYAALMGAAKTPDLFQCAISFAGISDVALLRSEARNLLYGGVARDQLGGSFGHLRAVSPARLAEQVKSPVLLIHGEDDTVVPVTQSRLMANALSKHNKAHEYIELKGGGHYLDYLPHRKQTFEAMETFLLRHLPAGPLEVVAN